MVLVSNIAAGAVANPKQIHNGIMPIDILHGDLYIVYIRRINYTAHIYILCCIIYYACMNNGWVQFITASSLVHLCWLLYIFLYSKLQMTCYLHTPLYSPLASRYVSIYVYIYVYTQLVLLNMELEVQVALEEYIYIYIYI